MTMNDEWKFLDVIKRKNVAFPSFFNKGNKKKILYHCDLVVNIPLKGTACRKIRQVFMREMDKL